MRARRWLLLAFFAYLAVDLGSPFVPGAFTFDPAESVEAASALRLRPSDVAAAVTAPSPALVAPRLTPPPVRVAGAAPAPAPHAWRPHTGTSHHAANPHPSTDDD